MKALTIDAWWAWAIVCGPKRIENRSWRTAHRGPLAIHAGRHRGRDAEAIAFLRAQGLALPSAVEIDLLRGRVIGTCRLAGCVRVEDLSIPLFPSAEADSPADPWATGPWCWLLEEVERLAQPPMCVGRRQLWDWQG